MNDARLFLTGCFLTAVATLCFLCLYLPNDAGASWGLLGQDDVYAIYVDEGSITLISDTASKVWIKVVPKRRDVKEGILKSRRVQGVTVKGYETFAYRMESVEIECALERYRVLETADYDENDRKLSASFPIAGWSVTGPVTPYDSLAKLMCQEHSEDSYWWDACPDHQSHEEQ